MRDLVFSKYHTWDRFAIYISISYAPLAWAHEKQVLTKRLRLIISVHYWISYNMSNYSHILIGFDLWSIFACFFPPERSIWHAAVVCSAKDHRWHQNMVRTSVTHSAIASCVTFLFLVHFDVSCDLLLNVRSATWKNSARLSVLNLMAGFCQYIRTEWSPI